MKKKENRNQQWNTVSIMYHILCILCVLIIILYSNIFKYIHRNRRHRTQYTQETTTITGLRVLCVVGSNERGRSVFAARVGVVGRYRLDY